MKKPATPCYHGGTSFSAIGDEFDALERRHQIINADVLDAWFPPSPRVVAALNEDLPWLLRTSPPAQADGLTRVISRARGVPVENVLPGAGSSALIFLALREWLTPASRVLLLDPTYGEYAHVLEHLIGCRVVRLPLLRENGFRVDLKEFCDLAETGYDLIVLVNPNNPTGQFIPHADLEAALRCVPSQTLVWVDEAYLDYVGPQESLESFAAASANVVVCKSLSKVYALSGARAAYLCGPERLLARLRGLVPPWAIGLPAQVAVVAALEDPNYYAIKWEETHWLREQLAGELARLTNWEVLPGCANFLLCHLPASDPAAAEICRSSREYSVYLRDVASMGRTLGDRSLRIAVKDAATNAKIIKVLVDVASRIGSNLLSNESKPRKSKHAETLTQTVP
jgi:histidinol-phosphate/aromatic aminotransferase/cobyric acid decarboxylase-like protein